MGTNVKRCDVKLAQQVLRDPRQFPGRGVAARDVGLIGDYDDDERRSKPRDGFTHAWENPEFGEMLGRCAAAAELDKLVDHPVAIKENRGSELSAYTFFASCPAFQSTFRNRLIWLMAGFATSRFSIAVRLANGPSMRRTVMSIQ